jgi:hypothetical protein
VKTRRNDLFISTDAPIAEQLIKAATTHQKARFAGKETFSINEQAQNIRKE